MLQMIVLLFRMNVVVNVTKVVAPNFLDDKGYSNVTITQGPAGPEPTATTDCDKTPLGWCAV